MGPLQGSQWGCLPAWLPVGSTLARSLNCLSPPELQERELQQRLLDEQFAVLRSTAAEAERILQDAVGKLDDPLHMRCTSSPGAISFPPLLEAERPEG